MTRNRALGLIALALAISAWVWVWVRDPRTAGWRADLGRAAGRRARWAM
jgi:hypothetical protein